MQDFDIIGPSDHPALLAISTPDAGEFVKEALAKMGYKVHEVDNYDQFELRYNQVNYEVVVIEQTFASLSSVGNPALRMVQELPMTQRRHAAFFLVGPGLETLNPLQAFGLSVHCVINYRELPMLPDLVRKTVGENEMFLTTLRDVQRRVYQKVV